MTLKPQPLLGKYINELVALLKPLYPMAKRWLHRFNGGVYPAYMKNLSADKPIHEMIIPPKLIIPLQQQIGQSAELLVEIGEQVKKNQLIANSSKDAGKALVVPIHAPTSGVIREISEQTLPHPSGLKDICIVLEPDGKDESIQNVLGVDGKAPQSPQALKDIILQAGIIGMGGAGFPTYAKIPNEKNRVEMVLINGAECEPFITCDDLLMQNEATSIIEGAVITAQALGAPKIVCGIEANKQKALEAMRHAAKLAEQNDHCDIPIEIIEVETVYPMGGQEQLIYELTGYEVPHDKHAIQVDLLMMNVATYAAIYRAVHYGEPLTCRLVTITGLELNESFNIRAMIGTPFDTLIGAAKPKRQIDFSAIMGGPMMGFRVASNQVPVLKTTNCVLVNRPEPEKLQMPCIRCGECMDACPINLLPQQMYWHAQAQEFNKVEKLNVFNCIECGCCSYVCPSNIPLVQYYRHAKSEIRQLNQEAAAAEVAKQRHEFRLERLEREKQEREARLKAKKAAVKQQLQKQNDADKAEQESAGNTPASAAAKARAAAAKAAAAKRKQTSTEATSDTDQTHDKAIPAARRRAIEAAKKASAKAAAKNASDSTTTKQSSATDEQADKKNQAKQAAMAAAKKAAAKRAEQKKSADDNNLAHDYGTANNSASTEAKTKPDARQQAIEKARQKAREMAAKKAAEKNSTPKEADDND
ncbi:electron transport complex subunit RsxC [Thiomicrorhabdus sediminis]|uniref:Ion-translocating oxidoreductase complex subunit C n=1 Tax=Thiomicrorhabdus sediminis TaxID=2580412 RepID=A0A4P9K5Q0_9GAMM|nr:electron transport complex subunit RsxC [Thiomicrorhabdus sediminis]QCU90325.1 electron transport complex subunit RsxC [Thiomicrorhabdus sediminis]